MGRTAYGVKGIELEAGDAVWVPRGAEHSAEVEGAQPEVSLDAALKSLSGAYRLYHYPSLPCDHLLLTPNGLVVLETVNLASYFTYKDGHWRERIGIGRALRYIVEEHLGDPFKSATSAAQFLEEQVNQMLEGKSRLPVRAVVVFTPGVAEVVPALPGELATAVVAGVFPRRLIRKGSSTSRSASTTSTSVTRTCESRWGGWAGSSSSPPLPRSC